jgi:peptidoglycan hydrolase CwlO-like protein
MTRTHASAHRSHEVLGLSAPGLGVRAACVLMTMAVLLAVVITPARASAATQAEVKAKARLLSQQVAHLDQRIDTAVAAYVRATDALGAVKAEIAANQRQLSLAQFNIVAARQALAERVVAAYKQQGGDVLSLVFSSRSFTDLLGSLDVMQRVSLQDSRTVTQLDALTKQVSDRRTRLQADAEAAAKLVGQLSGTITQIRGELTGRKNLLAGAQAEVARLAAAVKRPKLVLPTGTTPATSTVPGHGQWWPLIESAAASNGVDATGVYRLMMIESGGNPAASNGGHYFGLFQFAPSTWRADWNPWRTADILDGAAQIKATALAIKLGHSADWWPNTFAWAFGK